MNRKRDLVLGIDTSNYKTSVAVTTADGAILCDLRKLLKVKQGERGLRQSDALFQHVENLPSLIDEAVADERVRRIGAVACSDRPRPVSGSYMPVFKAGTGFGQALASALQVPYYTFSHQEGHIEAVRVGCDFCDPSRFLCYQLSGGTCELLCVESGEIRVVGGSKDLSFGQLIDRIGVKLGMAFPAGEEMDHRASASEQSSGYLTEIPVDGLFFNLSGIETQCGRRLEALTQEGCGKKEREKLVRELFDKIVGVLIEVTGRACRETSITEILFTGGVSSSRYIRDRLKASFARTPFTVHFGQRSLSQDNAVGIAFLGGRSLWP